MNVLYRLTAFWYSRIALFVVLLVVAVIATGAVTFIGQELLYALVLVVSLAVEQARSGGVWYTLGFPRRWILRQTALGLLLAVVMIGVAGGVGVLLGAQWQYSVWQPAPGELLYGLLLFAVWSGGEEIVFRGVVFQALYERFGATATILSTSVAFALAHLWNPAIGGVALLNIALAGVLMSWMYVQTRALWLPWAFHFGWNAAQHYLLGSPVSGVHMGTPVAVLSAPDSALYRVVVADAFGIEGGVLTALLLLAGMAVVSLPGNAQPAPELAARLFRRQYAESLLRHTLKAPWGRATPGPHGLPRNAGV